jgi:1-acyl-sn-glycerol-3-phosphate acyltransferase
MEAVANTIPELRRIPGAARYARALVRFICFFMARVRVFGLENLPERGPFIIASNHLSRFDPPIGFMVVDRPELTGFAGDTYRKRLIFRLFLESAGVIWVNRGHTDRATMKAALAALKQGAILGIAPEGTRSQTGALIQGKTGAAFLAARADVPIAPAALTGTEKMAASIMRLRRQLVTLTFGKPFRLEPLPGLSNSERLDRHTAEIMCRIAALLPPEYRGVYADHPRLLELLAQGG